MKLKLFRQALQAHVDWNTRYPTWQKAAVEPSRRHSDRPLATARQSATQAASGSCLPQAEQS